MAEWEEEERGEQKRGFRGEEQDEQETPPPPEGMQSVLDHTQRVHKALQNANS